MREILSSISRYHLGKTNQDTSFDIDQNQAGLVGGSSRQGHLAYGMVLVGVDMALLEIYLFLYKFGLF